MTRNQLFFLFRMLCAGLALLLVAGCVAGGDPTASSRKSGGKGSSGDTPNSEPVDSDEAGSADVLSQSAPDPVAVAQTALGKQSSFDVSKNGVLQAYPEYDARIERDYAYTVTVTQGSAVRSLTCYNHCDAVSTSERTVNGDMYRRFCEFAFADAPVRVDVAVKQDFASYTVMPSAKGFRSERHGNVISIYMEKPDYLLLKLDDKDDSILSIFADAPETDVPRKGDPGVLYIEGWYEPDDWHLDITRSDYTVYLAPGSVLNARVIVTGTNVTIKGRGMILDPFSDINHFDIDTDFKADGANICRILNVRGKNCTIDGIKLIDARTFNLLVAASDLTCTNFKVLSSEMCTDGITQSGDNNHYEHIFIYNGDNGIVITNGKNQVYKDVTIGTICCGIFPQLSVGEIDITDLYLFRADEGLMRNLYNPNHIEPSFDIKMTNVSCVDCDHFPFLFMGGNYGHNSKTITFKNLAVPYATGSASGFAASPTTNTLRRGTRSDYIETTNYNLVFDGLSIGGQAVTDAAQIPCAADNRGSLFNITVKGNGATWVATPATVTGASTAPGKIFVGGRQLLLKNAAVEKDGAWYVPAAGVCQALACAVPGGTTTINGEAYLSLDALKAAGCTTSATHDASAQAVRIAPADRGDNLLGWFHTDYHSHWSEYICYNTQLLYVRDAAGDYFKNQNSKVNTGASYALTQQLQQYGKGTYTFTADMKADTDAAAKIVFSVNKTGAAQTVNLTSSWQKVTLTFSCDKDKITNACLKIVCAVENSGVAFRNPVLTHSK